MENKTETKQRLDDTSIGYITYKTIFI